jgi:23S rRNA (guanosine2251-2'-O)-methyltransferase
VIVNLCTKLQVDAMEHLNIFQVSNIIQHLKNLREKNFWVYGFDAKVKKILLI